jgi:hypothetical protein
MSTNDIACVLELLLIRILGDEKMGERLRLWIASRTDGAAQTMTKCIR